jgi:methylated-DNA-protein-cysteine methyltransferase-like protein
MASTLLPTQLPDRVFPLAHVNGARFFFPFSVRRFFVGGTMSALSAVREGMDNEGVVAPLILSASVVSGYIFHMPRELTEEIIEAIRDIPEGMVCTYGAIAKLAGNPRAARQVVRVLHTYGEKEELPWWRVINREGRISLKPGFGYEVQRELLEAEGVEFGAGERVDLKRFGWEPDDLDSDLVNPD